MPGTERLREVVGTLADIAGALAEQRGGTVRVAVRGPDHEVLAAHLRAAAAGRPVEVLDGDAPVAGRPADVVVAIRTGPAPGDGPPAGDVVVEWRDRTWPVLRHVARHLPWSEAARRRETRAFFAIRAPGWDARFGDDL